MKFEILPKLGVGDLRFGMSRADARRTLGVPYESFSREGAGRNESDIFDQIGVRLDFSLEERLEFIELFHPAEPTISGVSLIGRNAEQVHRELAMSGLWGVSDDSGYDFRDWGFGLYAPVETVEGVSVYMSGYYER